MTNKQSSRIIKTGEKIIITSYPVSRVSLLENRVERQNCRMKELYSLAGKCTELEH